MCLHSERETKEGRGRANRWMRKLCLLEISFDYLDSLEILTSTQPSWIFHLTPLDFGMQSRHTLIVERNLSADQDVKNDSKTPNIHFWTSVSLCIEKLWCRKVERSTEGTQMRVRRKEIRETEIDDLDVSSFRDEDVFNLEIYRG